VSVIYERVYLTKMQIMQLANKNDIDLLEQAIRLAYACDPTVPCAALSSASYLLFRQTCEHDLQTRQHSDLCVTLPWPYVHLAMSGGQVIIQRKAPVCSYSDSSQENCLLQKNTPYKRIRVSENIKGEKVLKTFTNTYNASSSSASNYSTAAG
jgi:hypothetical protein